MELWLRRAGHLIQVFTDNKFVINNFDYKKDDVLHGPGNMKGNCVVGGASRLGL
jgi:hypothetical protein